MKQLRHLLVDVHARRIYPALVTIDGSRIASIVELPAHATIDAGYLIPGFVDAHVHVESSMLPPQEFARIAVRHGTVATVSDPHEISNVLGEAGVEYMLTQAQHACMPIAFGVPSCVPATEFETSGARLNAADVARLLSDPRLTYLAEMMNWPGVLHGDAEVIAKIEAAKRVGKLVDGHAPGLRGDDAKRYIAAGISSDHECTTLDEARDKAQLGMHILIREGSAARNLEALWPIIAEFPHLAMFSTDDAHPDELLRGHINRSVARCIAHGLDLYDVLRAASVNPAAHYRLPTGLLRANDRADFALVEDLCAFKVLETWICGEVVARDGKSLSAFVAAPTPNQFRTTRFESADFAIRVAASDAPNTVRVIEAIDGQLVTREVQTVLMHRDGILEADTATDTLLIAVCNRYHAAAPALGFVRGFGLTRGACATSVAHDSHQVIAVGATREAITRAVNAVFQGLGGLAFADDDAHHDADHDADHDAHHGAVELLKLPIAGLMSDQPAEEVARAYESLTAKARSAGSPLRAPFMTLSFMALLVIPELKLSDRGLFDARAFRFTPVILQS